MLTIVAKNKTLALWATVCVIIGLAGPVMSKEKAKKKVKPVAAPVVEDLTPLVNISPAMATARTYYRTHDYNSAILVLRSQTLDLDGKWMLAESLFRTNRFAEARSLFVELRNTVTDKPEKAKALMREFECALRAKDLQGTIDSHLAYKKLFKKAGDRMNYGLAKALYDGGFDKRAEILLKSIPAKSEFAMRARYIQAALALTGKNLKQSVKRFNQITKMTPASVEDHGVLELAKLAVARLYVDMQREDMAEKAYLSVNLNMSYAEQATVELVRIMIARAENAALKLGRFKKLTDFESKKEYNNSLKSALSAIDRFRSVNKIDTQNPELLTLVAQLYGKSKRYDEANTTYESLIGYYRNVQTNLLNTEPEAKKVWPYFSLELYDDQLGEPQYDLITGVPNNLTTDVPELAEIINLKHKIFQTGRKLKDLEKKAEFNKLEKAQPGLSLARAKQIAMERAYEELVLGKQSEIQKLVSVNINNALAEAEFKRAEIKLDQMRDFKKQLDYVRDFQAKNIDMFEKELNETQNGGAL